ncbi:branched-chain amino acid ABC transporter permease [Aurantimonas sp. C2-6-R+9]|uniref:branched-chain amino acid ABC transporter permease n=1 Tax=unclassified Aurantimonas TaxID=2638230 RepID=UPI002E17C061|nr:MULTISPECIES: branched-chain amino acid ABC transporter permease [unclassified Aurantimonas]MEC5292382.1 branched-chain amino acid ABC transporter permease [Aurantimonas sp. C2-3-R2]MEC5382535.1 branched-chain amino acid ABC transporter permease [Aurantimonas sp. C2-6-R+9]MEC5411833.1 branched-chain amino acid ABC transporter permease [Aurantimonas sp. C2-4-R8]
MADLTVRCFFSPAAICRAMDLLLQTGLNAIYAASYMSLVAVGLVLIFGVMGVINFAHGELFMAGAYAVVALYADLAVPFPIAVAAGLVFVGILGLAMERALFRPLRDNPLGGLVASIGFLMVLQAAAVLLFGVRMEHVPPVTQDVIIFFERVRFPVQRLYVVIAAIVLLTALWLFLKKTRFGWALRASAQDPEAAALQGIAINQTARIAMFIGAALAGVAGALSAPLVSVNPYMGHSVIITAFIVIIVGGVGSLEGAVVAAVAYAFIHTFVTTFWDGVIADIVGLGLMLLVLIVKPTGLFGTVDRA